MKDESDKEGLKIPGKVTILTSAGLVIAAAIICLLLWHFTHLDRESNTEARGENTPVEDFAEESVCEATAQEPEAEEVTNDLMSEESTLTESREEVPPQSTVEEELVESREAEEGEQEHTGMQFTEVSEEVTAKDVTNLRLTPSTLELENVVAQLKNGEVLLRTGINIDAGWSRLLYNGEVVYAVSRYVTADLNYKTPVRQTDPNRFLTQDKRMVVFEDCNDHITPKEYVNLRTEPSTSQGESTVRCQLQSGEVVHRTGCSPDAGWSRVEYNGEILYVVSSYMKAVQ